MQRKAKTFFLLLMSIFLFGVVLHLIIPIQIVVNATQKIEQAYNGYKIQVEQTIVRSIAYLNSLAISNQIQIYQNIRSTVIRLFQTGDRYQVMDATKVKLYSAYQLAHMSDDQLVNINLDHTMWYVQGISSIEQMNEGQKWVLMLYAQFQQYLAAINIKSDFHLGLKSIQITIDYEGLEFYFEHPSSKKPEFAVLDWQVLTADYNLTILNYQTSNRYQTLIKTENTFKACSSILNEGYPFAVVCLEEDLELVTKRITSVLKVPNFQLSVSRYFLIKPLYPFQNSTYPEIISYFTSDDLQKVYVPINQTFTQIKQNLQGLFNSRENYFLHVQQIDKTKTYYVIPIENYNNIDTKQIIAYLVVVNDFAKSEIKGASHYKQFFVIMIVPSTILLLIAAVSMGLIMRPIFAKLQHYSLLMNEYCHFIHKNDMSLQVNEEGQTTDFIQIFKSLKCLNLLNKISNIEYLKVEENQRIVKLHRALQLFDQLGYSADNNKINIYENLAQCYQKIGQYANALKYLQLSVSTSITQLGGIQNIEMLVRQTNEQKSTRRKTISSKQRTAIKHLRYKIFKLCSLLYQMHTSGNSTTAQQMAKNVHIMKKLLPSSSISVQYAYCFILQSICSYQNNIPKLIVQEKIDQANDMIRKIQASNSKSVKMIPVQILKSYRYYLKAKLLKSDSKYLQSFENFVLALDGTHYDPKIHQKIKNQIIQICQICQIDVSGVLETFSHLQSSDKQDTKQKNSQRQFIFLSDVSNPSMSMNEFNQWKSKARKMGQYIFQNYITAKDRIGISEFCNDLKIVCNLIEKRNNESMLKKQLMSCIKARDQTIFSQLIPNLKRVIQRMKNLKKQKIFIIYLKQGIQIDSEQLLQQIEKAQKSTFIFLVNEDNQRLVSVNQKFYVVNFDDYQDIDLILGDKTIKKADNIIYLL